MTSLAVQRQWHQVVGILAKRGGSFAVIKKGSKLPTRTGWNQTANGIDGAQAREHLHYGDNITLLCGTGNLYAFDLDADADRGHECAQLAGGLYIYRENAPHKAKFIFSCPDPIPTRLKNKSSGIDLLGLNSNGTHWSCVVAGTHNSGAPLKWGGHTVPVLAADTVAALWEEWTGQELFPTYQDSDPNLDSTYADADLARLADALKHVDPNDMDYNAWVGKIGAIHDAFDGSDEALDLAIAWADGKPGEVEQKWKSFDREYSGVPATLESIFYLARKGGWPDTWLQDRLQEYKRWLAAPETIEELRGRGFKRPEKTRKLLDTVLQKCEERKSLRVTPGYAYLSKHSTIGIGHIGDYLGRLFAAGLINLKLGENGGSATLIELVLHNGNTSVAGDAASVFDNWNSYTPTGETIPVVKNWHIYREQRSSEAFINNHYAYSSTRTQATLPSLGDNGLGVLMALLEGPATTKEAADRVGYTYGTMAYALRHWVPHGAVEVSVGERGRKTYTLKEEWRTILEANLPKMPTYGVQQVRYVDALKSKVRFLEHKGEVEKAEKVEKEYLRQKDLLAKVKQAHGIIPFVRPLPSDKQQPVITRAGRQVVSPEVLQRRERTDKYKNDRAWRDGALYKSLCEAAGPAWGELNAWAVMNFGPGWWMALDQADIMDKFQTYQHECTLMPLWARQAVAV